MCALLVDAIPGQRLRFRLEGKLAEPNTARWKAASAAERRLYYPILADRLLVEWRGQMLAGRGRRGKLRRALAISRLGYQQEGEEHRGPALLPRREESRAWRHARVTPYADLGRVTGYFIGGTARFLSYHHTGTAGRGVPYFDDAGRLVGWRGLRGQVTGIVRDLMPTATTISLAVSSASVRWARSLPKPPKPKPVRKPKPGRAAAPVKPKPRSIPATPPRRFADPDAAAAWASANLRTPVAGFDQADPAVARDILAALGRVEARIGGRLPVPIRFVGRIAGNDTAIGVARGTRDGGVREIEIKGRLSGETYDEIGDRGDRLYREHTGRGEPWMVGGPGNRAEALVWHELGHVVDSLRRNPNGGLRGRAHALRRLWFDEGEAGEAAMRGVSGYAATDWYGMDVALEAWAECWTAIVARTPQAEHVPEAVRKMVEDAYADLSARVVRGDFAPEPPGRNP